MTIFDRALVQGTLRTRSLLIPGRRGTVTATADLPDGAKNDPNLRILATLQIGSKPPDPTKPLSWSSVKELEWTGGSGTVPTLTWTGDAYRARVEFEVTNPAYVGWDANAVPAP